MVQFDRFESALSESDGVSVKVGSSVRMAETEASKPV